MVSLLNRKFWTSLPILLIVTMSSLVPCEQLIRDPDYNNRFDSQKVEEAMKNHERKVRFLSEFLNREASSLASKNYLRSLTGNSSTVFYVQVTAIHVDKAEFPLPKLMFKLALSVAEKSLESKRVKLLLNVRSANTCSSQYAGAIAAEEYYLKKARLFIVSGCDDAIRGVSRLASGWRVPVMTAAGFGADLNDKTVHRTLIRVAFSLKTAVKFLVKILKSFQWQRVNLIVDESDANSLSLKDSIEKHLLEAKYFNLNVVPFDLQSLISSASSSSLKNNKTLFESSISKISNKTLNPNEFNQKLSIQSNFEDSWPNEVTERAIHDALRQSSLFSRVNILLISQEYLRKFMLSAYDQNMANGLYTFINIPLLLLANEQTQQQQQQQVSLEPSHSGSKQIPETDLIGSSKASYTSSIGEDVFIWRSIKSPRNNHAKQAYESLMSIYLRTPTTKAYVYFTGKLLNLANSDYATTTRSPLLDFKGFNKQLSTGSSRLQLNVNPYTASFYDCLMIYHQALEESLVIIDRELTSANSTQIQARKSLNELHSIIVKIMKNRRYDNLATGSIFINEDGDRESDYTLDDMNPMTGKFSPVILYKGQSKNIERIGKIHWSSDSSIGATIDNVDCTLTSSCPGKPWTKFQINLILVLVPLGGIVGTILYFVYNQINLESQLVDYWWKLSYKDIELLDVRRKKDGSTIGNNSQVSLKMKRTRTGSALADDDCTDISDKAARDTAQAKALTNSGPDSTIINKSSSAVEKPSVDVTDTEVNKTISITRATEVSTNALDVCYGNIQLGLYKLSKVALKPIDKFNQSRKLMIELRTIKNIDHNNLCRFIGIITETEPTMAIVTEFCPKGSLREFFQNESMVIDWTFKYSIINDILAGLLYLNSSPLEYHGRLKSCNCLVSSRFVVKLSDYGLSSIYEQLDNDSCDNDDLSEQEAFEKKLWLAPEHMKLTGMNKGGSMKGDVYSFGLLLFEILTNKNPFHEGDKNTYRMPLKALCSELKINGPSSDKTGPDLSLINMELNNMDQLVNLMKRSWNYDPSKRPTMQEVNAILRRITKDVTSKKLLENLTSRMEQYTNNLESLVEAKLATLVDEKLKTEELLYQFVPKSVALLLKEDQTVEPEAFDCVTVFYSDIVGFTSLSSESSPMEVIDFLSELYLCFDETLQHYDIFKVDTIGDAYIVASGLPQRNEGKHVIEIARAALELRQRISSFKIAHKPGRKLEMRVGINSGPCIAGIVGGLNMPKYCVFGDTLTMGKFMESSGLPMRIHVTEDSKQLLDNVGGFKLEQRVPKITKDGLPMQTYWLEDELNR